MVDFRCIVKNLSDALQNIDWGMPSTTIMTFLNVLSVGASDGVHISGDILLQEIVA